MRHKWTLMIRIECTRSGKAAGDRNQDVRRRSHVAELKKGTRITGAERDKLATDLRKRYEKGQSIRVLAETSGRSYGFVHRILSESGATLRGRGGATRGKKTA
jgi:hypothetical protein